MNDKKVLQVIGIYEQKLTHMLEGGFKDNTKLAHALKMCGTVADFVRYHRMPKAFRWLGFIQGVLWCEGVYTIEEMKNHNRPTKDEVREEYPGHTFEDSNRCPMCPDSSGCQKSSKLKEAL